MLSLKNSGPKMCKKLAKRKNLQCSSLFSHATQRLVKHLQNGKVVSTIGDVSTCYLCERFKTV